MSHRKVHSQGNVPFSWEDRPGISKVTNHEYPTTIVLNTLILKSPPPSSLTSTIPRDKKIPPPPCSFQPPRRSFSAKGIWQQEDPFLAALKECTKNVRNGEVVGGESKKNVGSSKLRKKKFIFSCKEACDVVKDNNLVRPYNFPPLPRERYGGLIKIRD